MSDKPQVSDRAQYVIGTMISIVLVTVYLLLTSDPTGSSGLGANDHPVQSGEVEEIADQSETIQPEERQ